MEQNILEEQLSQIIVDENMSEDIKLAKIDMLVRLGVDVNTKIGDLWGRTILMVAIAKDQKKIAEFLIQEGADVNANNNYGETVLMYASSYGQKEIVELLIQKGADVNATSRRGMTALLFAAYEHKDEIISLLIHNGADINAKNVDGKTAIGFADIKTLKAMLRAVKGVQKKERKRNEGKSSFLGKIKKGFGIGE